MKKILFAISTTICLVSPAVSQTVSPAPVKGAVKETVSVRRDSRSIPYIDARNESDMYFAQGYVTASDRLWQMDLLRRVARGEASEIFGKLALEEDKRWRRFGFAKVADDSLAYLSPQLRSALESYAHGVNAYITSLDDKSLPVEFRILQYRPREWKPADSIVIGKILADALSTTWRNDLLRATLQTLPKEKIADLTNQVTPYDVVLFGKDTARVTAKAQSSVPESDGLANVLKIADRDVALRESSLSRVGLYAEDLAASNNWVISGKRTADGKPLLANDPHLLPTAPGIWYLTHLSAPTVRASGVTFPGVPGIVLGHNESVAWGATNVGPDVQDLYLETFGADGKYKTPSGTADTVIRREEIRVRTNPLKTDTETVMLDVVETRNGPIIIEDGGKRYALKWTARDPKNNEFEAFYFLNRAKDWSEFKNALRSYGGATQNFVYADVKGNIGWYAAGRIPLRKVGDGAMPYDGSTDDGEWTGTIPFDELPNLYNPAEGFIVTANQRIVGTSYKYQQMSRDASAPWRARRIYDLLKANTKVTMDDATAVQLDAFNLPVKMFADEMVKLNAGSATTIDKLKAWDGVMRPDSAAALLANDVRLCVAAKVAADNVGVPSGVVATRVVDYGLLRTQPARWLPKAYPTYADLMKTCEGEVVATMPQKYGADPAGWTWAATSKSRFPHPLAAAPLIGGQFATPSVGISGSRETPNVASFVSMRHVASPGSWDLTRHVIPLGQSGNPQSPHFKDQFEMWRTGAPAVFPFTKQAVEAAAKVELVFQPER